MAETDDEIADLERKLKELKETKQAEEETAELPEVVKVEVKDGFDMTTLSMRKKVAVSGAPEVASELLSRYLERWPTFSVGAKVLGEKGCALELQLRLQLEHLAHLC